MGKSDVQQNIERLDALLDDIEPILNAHGYSWGTAFSDGDIGCYAIHIMPKEQVYEE